MSHADGREENCSERLGVVGVCFREDRFLVIRRAAGVAAPGAYCFPGGGREAGESEAECVVRELHEELACDVRPQERLWESVTAWRVRLAWWRIQLEPGARLVANPAEVQSYHWLTAAELRRLPDLLSSNRDFLDAWQGGQFILPADP